MKRWPQKKSWQSLNPLIMVQIKDDEVGENSNIGVMSFYSPLAERQTGANVLLQLRERFLKSLQSLIVLHLMNQLFLYHVLRHELFFEYQNNNRRDCGQQERRPNTFPSLFG